MAPSTDFPMHTPTHSSRRHPMQATPTGTPAGPMNNNLFINGENSPAWSVDIPLGANPGLRGGPYVLAFMDHPPLNIPLRALTPEERRVRVVSTLTYDAIIHY
ncbi:hypothetical protein F5Y11DRAFT_345038 [Daldinia sp. FL1419]|nr:hypothetical protein F5Y11DRAFT_345038 [Daldinia sp. FL1419]